MRPFYLTLLLACLLSAATCAGVLPECPLPPSAEPSAASLVAAYPDAGMTVEERNGNTFIRLGDRLFLFMPPGGCPRPDSEARDQPLCSMLMQIYPPGPGHRDPVPGFEPGRARNQEFFKELYGRNAKEVQRNSIKLHFFGQPLFFNARHGAAAALERALRNLEAAAEADPRLKEYMVPPGGTFLWRVIKQTNRLSPHSFAMTIDLNADKGVYWDWDPLPTPEDLEHARSSYPQLIVDIFESEGFIWGGKWEHFDYMHFEYRPELVRARRPGGRTE